MKVVLLKDVPGLGKAGAFVNVKDGYATNLLLPRGLAVVPNSTEARSYLKSVQQRALNQTTNVEKRRALSRQFDGQTIILPAKVGAQGKLFGSVTATQVAALINVDKRFIMMPKSIREVGLHPFTLSFGNGIKASLTLKIVDSTKTS